MFSVTSKRSGKFYFSISLYILFCLTMALIIEALNTQAKLKAGEVIMILIATVFVFGIFYILIRFYKNTPKITIDDESISFNDSTYYWKNLENIEMTGKRPFKFMGEQTEGALLKFYGQDERYIFDDMYGNISEIKSFIQELAIDKKPVVVTSITEANSGDITDENVIYYKGSQLLCIEGIMLWLLGLFFLYVIVLDVIKYSSQSVSWLLVFMGLFYFIFSRRMYHFGLSGSRLMIRNGNFFWYNTIYFLTDIKEIVFEQRHNMPVTLRVINNDFTSGAYPADTISDKKWLMLKKDLEAKGVKVRNECVLEEKKEPVRFKFFND